MKTAAISSLFHDIFIAVLFVALSGAVWLFCNNFNIARDVGFDPLRYEYFARSELPDYLSDSSSYTIVYLLKFIYSFLPFYYGFLVFCAACLSFLLIANRNTILRYAILSPITFFYIAQTGKDGLAILALVSICVIASTSIYRFINIPLLGIIVIALSVRPALIIFLPLVYVVFRFGLKAGFLLSLFLVSGFTFLDLASRDTLELLEGVVSDEGSGSLAKLGREFTFGYSFSAIAGRLVLLFVAPIVQPIGSVIKFLSGGESYILFEGGCQLFFVVMLINKKKVTSFFKYSIPFCVAVAVASPFYHFRYMAILYPVIYASVMFDANFRNINKSLLLQYNKI